MKIKCIIYEGVFDPPNINHYWLLTQTIEKLNADAIVVVANDISTIKLCNKPNASSENKRLIWSKKAFKDITTNVIISPKDCIYTVDLIQNIKNNINFSNYKEWFYLQGPDRNINTYKDSKKIKKMVKIISDNVVDFRSSLIRNRLKENKHINGLLAPNLTIEDIRN